MGQVKVDRYKELVENLNDAVYTVDTKTLRFKSVNEAGETLTGYSRKELLGQPITKLIPPDYLPIVRSMIQEKQRNNSTIYEIEILRKDGTQVPIEISSRALYNSKGKPVEILGIARNISERKAVERQRNIFVSILTHEIKNPLTSVSLYVSLLQKHLQNDKEALGYIGAMDEQVTAINQFMADFLDASQMRIGKFSISKEKTDLNEIIDEVMEVCKVSTHMFKKKGRPKKKAMADKRRIRQVMFNLVSNAIKYSPPGSQIVVKTINKPSEVAIAIQDSGSGIMPSEQAHIFDLFVRTGEAYRNNVQGHGLGLYISREIIKLHDGKLWVDSLPGHGSTFSFSLPY